MEILSTFVDFILHLDKHLIELVQHYGNGVYLILFLIVFAETGLVVMPFLPGDSLLFVTGALAAGGALNVHTVAIVLMAAAFAGDNTNYWIGRYVGPKVFRKKQSRFLNPQHLQRTQDFYDKHGGKTIVLARFLPIIRTFAPFVAGIGKMSYKHFIGFSLLGSLCWIGFFVYGGYYFGNIPFVKNNLTYFIFGIVIVSLVPGLIAYLRNRFSNKQ